MQPSTKQGHLRCKNHLHIPFDQWNPGSIQANRTRDSRVRFRHRHAEIILSARFRAPEWGQALLEEWLMAQRGEESRPKSSEQRLATIRRSKASIERYLEQSNLDYAAKCSMMFNGHSIMQLGNYRAIEPIPMVKNNHSSSSTPKATRNAFSCCA